MKNAVKIPQEIFRAYDIRGIVGETLTAEIVYEIGKALGSEAQQQNEHTIIIGRDGRLSGPELITALAQGILATGCHVIDIGAVPTPVLYFATHHLEPHSGVMLTGSHNPPNYNGLKMVIKSKTLFGDDIQAIYQRTISQNFLQGQGKLQQKNIDALYINTICKQVKLKRPMKIVIDCGNGITGKVAPSLFKQLGAEVISLFADVNGNFPNHQPDPSQPENLQDLIKAIAKHQADVGLAFDGDGDRLGVVTNQGEIIYADRQLMVFAKNVLQKNPGAEIIFDVKCTRHLPTVITAAGGIPLLWKTGHSFIKNKMQERNTPLAGEMSGHIFFGKPWFGFDDGLYAGARMLEILSQDPRSSQEVFASFPNSINTPELKLYLPEEQKFIFMENFLKQAKFENGKVSTIDGLRVDFPDSFGLIRPSNTSPCLILRFEADDAAGLQRIQTLFRQQLLKLDQNLKLPF